jgi:hypothetical protein
LAVGVADGLGLAVGVAAAFVGFVPGATLDALLVGAVPAAPVAGSHPVSSAVTAAAVSRAAAPRDPIT